MDNGNVIFNNPDNSGQGADRSPQAGENDKQVQPAPNLASDQTQTTEQPAPPEGSPDTTQTQGAPDPASAEDPPGSGRRGIFKKLIIGLIILVIIILGVFIFLPRGDSDASAELVWWGLWEDQAVVASIIDEFERENPNIKIEYIKQDPKQYREKLQTRIQNGTGPDVFRFHNTWVPMLSGDLLPLSTDVITPEVFKETFYAGMQSDLSLNGALYGIPLGADALALFINTELFDAAGVEVPNTWEEFVEVSRKLTVKEGGKINTAGAALGTFGNVTHAPDIISLLFLQQGIQMNKFPDEDKEDKVAALSFYTSFAKGDQNVWDQTLDDSIVLFAKGNLGMYLGFSWDIFRIKSLNPEIKFQIHPLPQLVGRDVGLASYWVEGVSSKSKSQKAALLFLKFLAKKETAEKFHAEASKAREFGEIYARSDLSKSLSENKALLPFIKELENAQSSIFASDTYDGEGGINSMANVYLGNAVNSIINDNSSVETVVETLDQGVIQVFDKYGVQ